MSESETVKVEITQENAINLLEAAEELELDPSVVATTSFGWFEVPKEVADKAGVTVVEEEEDDEPPVDGKSPAPTKDEKGNLVPADKGESAPAAAKKAAAPKSKE